MSRDAAIQLRGLSKSYGDVRALCGVELEVGRGEIYGLLGRNGAGKTTAIRLLLGLAEPSAGSVLLLGQRLTAARRQVLGRVGCLVEAASAYPNLTLRENLELQRRLTRASRSAVEHAIALLRLEPYAERRAGQLSLGNRQRLALARALLHEPEILVLDEPTNALDPPGIVEIRELLRGLSREQGVTVFLSSHILAEVAQLADRIAILHQGKLLEEISVRALSERSQLHLDVVVSDAARALQLLRRDLPELCARRVDEQRLRVDGARGRAAEVARSLVTAGLELHQLTPVQEDLETHFLRLTGGEAA